MTLSPHHRSGIWRQILNQGHPVFMLNPQGQSKQPSAPTFVWFLASGLDSFPSLITELFWSVCRCHVLFWLSLVMSPPPATRALGRGWGGHPGCAVWRKNIQLGFLKHHILLLFLPLASLCNAEQVRRLAIFTSVEIGEKIILSLPAQRFKLKLGHEYVQSIKQNIHVYTYIAVSTKQNSRLPWCLARFQTPSSKYLFNNS